MTKLSIMINIVKHTGLITLFILTCICSYGQNRVDLEAIHQLILNQSFAAENAKQQKTLAEYNFAFYKSQLKPTISLVANLPNYSKTSSAIVQPDGTVAFQPIQQANSTLSAYAQQVLPSTGGTLFAISNLTRFDDFSSDVKQYNGIPIRVGISQPLFGFNPFKFDKIIQPLLLEEANKNYNLDIETALANATQMYFDILIAKQNLEIAETNEEVNARLLKITEERLILGKVSKDEKLQLEIELSTAQLSVSQAFSEVDQAIATLYTYIGMNIPDDKTIFEVPSTQAGVSPDIAKLLLAYQINRPELIAQQRALIETEKSMAQVKSDFGLQATLEASIGFARGAAKVSDIYTDPFDEQQFNISIQLPILDFGKRKSAMSQVQIQKEILNTSNEQQERELENSIIQRALLFGRLQNEIELFKAIEEKADQRFAISNERYVLGDIDITNLTLAQREKDQAKRNYINALQSYWSVYYNLRSLTGYDILQNQSINYN